MRNREHPGPEASLIAFERAEVAGNLDEHFP
jgi:hypothetical protein